MTPAPPVLLVDGFFRVEGNVTTLLGGRSRSTGRVHFPLRPVCPWTGTDDVEPVDLPRTGSLWAWTEVTVAPPGYSGPVPYHLGIVELDPAGSDDPSDTRLRVVGRVVGNAESELHLVAGAPMELTHDQVGDSEGNNALVWAFMPCPTDVAESEL